MSEQFLVTDIPDVLRRLRRDSNRRLKDVAELTGLSVSYLSDLETGRTNPAINTLRDVVAAQGYTLVFGLESSDKVFEMFGFVETQLLYALEKRDFKKALLLIAALIPEDTAETGGDR